MISCILLSAGLSSRFGSPKALAKLNKETVIEHLLNTLLSVNLCEIIVVLGADAERIKTVLLEHKKVKVVYNKNYNLGQTSSFKAGLQNIALEAQGIMLLPVDYPLIKKETFEAVIEAFIKNTPHILIPTWNGHKGHPPVFSSTLKEEFLKLDDALGLNTVARHYPPQDIFYLPVSDEGVLQSFNTAQEWKKLAVKKRRPLFYPGNAARGENKQRR